MDEAPLSGGLGALTDGVISSQPWSDVSNLSCTGPFVGWVINPTITFHFAGATSYSAIMIHSDDSDFGGVSTPSQAVVSDCVHSGTFVLDDPSNGSGGNPVWLSIDVSSLGLTGGTISVTLDVRSSYRWVFVDEVQFQGAAVPEPAGPALLSLGIAGALAVTRRRTNR